MRSGVNTGLREYVATLSAQDRILVPIFDRSSVSLRGAIVRASTRIRRVVHTTSSSGTTGFWAVGHEGTMFRSNAMQNGWQSMPTPAGESLNDVAFCDQRPGNGVAVGNLGESIYTVNNGNDWDTSDYTPSRPSYDLESLAYIENGIVLAFADNGSILLSQDCGREWERVFKDHSSQTNRFRWSHVSNRHSGYIIAGGLNGTMYFMAQEDEYSNWTRVQISPEEVDFYDFAEQISITDDSVDRWVVGSGGSIFHSSQNLEHWHLERINWSNGGTQPLFGIAVVGSSNNGRRIPWAVGANGTILRRDAGTGEWNQFDITDILNTSGQQISEDIRSLIRNTLLFRIVSGGRNDAWIAGDNGVVLYTSDGGVSWTFVRPSEDMSFRDIAIGENEVWLVSDSGGQFTSFRGLAVNDWIESLLSIDSLTETDLREIRSAFPHETSELELRFSESHRLTEMIGTLDDFINQETAVYSDQADNTGIGQDGDLSTIIFFNIQRLLFIVLFIILVQFLVNLYRYSVRISEYYSTLAAALRIAETSDRINLPELILAISSERIDFDRKAKDALVILEKLVREGGGSTSSSQAG